MNSKNDKAVLSDHKRYKKKLLPPLLAALSGINSPYSWARELVPELLWIALILETVGEREGIEICNEIGIKASQASNSNPKPLYANITSFNSLTGSEKSQIISEIDENNIIPIQNSLQPLSDIIPDHALRFFLEKSQSNSIDASRNIDIDQILSDLYDRHSRRSAITISVAFYMGLCQNKIALPEEIAAKVRSDFDNISDYPTTDASKAAAASFRASAAIFLPHEATTGEDHVHSEWLDRFWDAIGKHGDCVSECAISIDDIPEGDELTDLVYGFCRAAKTELNSRLEAWAFDLNRIETNEVVGALIARQTTLATQLALSPGSWNPISAPLFLRSMADVFISISWIIQDPLHRSRMFIEAGLGEIKLEIAHRRNRLKNISTEEKSSEEEYIKYLEDWLQSQRIEDMVEVNLGNWSGLNTRKMAEESNCLEFYNFVFQPFSSNVHSSWSHVSVMNTVYCQNPSHRFHRIATIRDPEADTHWVYLAGKYLDKTFRTFDKFIGAEAPEVTSFDVLREQIERCTSKINAKH